MYRRILRADDRYLFRRALSDGFHTLHALEQAGSLAPVVFVSTREEDELVGEAFRWGGHGYVVKSRIATDLAPAIDQVPLTRDLPFLTVCGYDEPALYESGLDVWTGVCAAHRAVA